MYDAKLRELELENAENSKKLKYDCICERSYFNSINPYYMKDSKTVHIPIENVFM